MSLPAGSGVEGSVTVVVGTRPEIIKMAPVVRALEQESLPWSLVHTGQHFSEEMDTVFFRELGLREPDVRLAARPAEGSTRHGAQTGRLLEGLETVFLKQRPAAVLVEGDTNTVLAGGLAAAKLGVALGHVEAGLRSRDRRMPEEVNRILVDHCADVLFAPTEDAASNLRAEGLPPDRILVTGNTIVDAVHQNLARGREKSRILERLGLTPRSYGVVTVHRQESVDSAERFRDILTGLSRIPLPLVYPIHPRSRAMAASHGLEGLLGLGSSLRVVDPLGYLDFLTLLADARLVLTDSGGIQEEACILQVPCLTLRENTERPETVAAGANRLVGTDPGAIVSAAREIIEHPDQERRMRAAKNPFGDGRSAERIAAEVRRRWFSAR